MRWFRAVVIIDTTHSDEWREVVSRWLVENGCLYVMAWGPGATTWENSVDLANIQAFDFGQVPDNRHVMTTSHDDESLEEVFWYAQFCAHEPYDLIRHTILLHVGTSDREQEFAALFVHAADLADRDGGKSRSIQ